MVKLRAPMMSLGASGSLGNAIVFSKWKGRAYARELVVPSNPKSGLQTGFRSMFKFCSQNWSATSSANKATWQTLADQLVASPFNAYMQANQKRWRNFNTPTVQTPVTAGNTIPTWTDLPDATAGVDSIVIDWTINAVEDAWGLIIYRALAPAFTPSVANAIHVENITAGGASSWLDSPLVADTYYYNFMAFTDDGVVSAALGEVNAVVT